MEIVYVVFMRDPGLKLSPSFLAYLNDRGNSGKGGDETTHGRLVYN